MKNKVIIIGSILFFISFGCKSSSLGSKSSTIELVDLDGIYKVEFEQTIQSGEISYCLDGIYFTILDDQEKTYQTAINMNGIKRYCPQLKGEFNEGETLSITDQALHPKIEAGLVSGSQSIYQKEDDVVVSFRVSGKAVLLKNLCPQYYKFLNASICQGGDKYREILIFKEITNAYSLSSELMKKLGYRKFDNKEGLVFKTCN